MGKKASYSPAMSDLDAGRRGPWVAPCPPPPQETWVAWLVPLIALANIVSFGYTMYVNDCPSTHRLEASDCVFPSLGRFAFEPFSINPLLGPSLYTSARLSFIILLRVLFFYALFLPFES